MVSVLQSLEAALTPGHKLLFPTLSELSGKIWVTPHSSFQRTLHLPPTWKASKAEI